MIVIVMGVSGCGKTTIGKLLAQKLELDYFDADDFHPKSNIEKMSRGISLNDEDRWPWLQEIADQMKGWQKGKGAVLSCSALKESYRKVFFDAVPNIHWVYLAGTYDLIKKRLEKRSGHYMKSDLLESQFNTLEEPKYGLKVDINHEPDKIIDLVMSCLDENSKAELGIFGLGVMGKSIALNALGKGISVAVFNRSEGDEAQIIPNFLKENNGFRNLYGSVSLQEFVDQIARPRRILIMIKAGSAIDQVIDQILPYLEPGDVLMDGGNSHFKDTGRRMELLQKRGIEFIGCGISGGEEGARKGPSMMPGGSKPGFQKMEKIFKLLAATDHLGNPCCSYIGKEGAGHFVKMIHNGIEYAEMQMLAELYDLLSKNYNKLEIADIFEVWNRGESGSYLLEITVQILRKKEGLNFLLDLILDKAENKGTGSWSSITALEFGQPTTLMTSAVFARYISSFKSKRIQLSQFVNPTQSDQKIDLNGLKKAYYFSRIINHQQGFQLIDEVSKLNNWGIRLNEVAQIWTNGCIIKSKLMEKCAEYLALKSDLFEQKELMKQLAEWEKSMRIVLDFVLSNRLSTPTFYGAYDYWVAMTTPNSSANLIQAQRDFFGAHTYQRTDREEHLYFHTNWLDND